jgi:hypothetical protein
MKPVTGPSRNPTIRATTSRIEEYAQPTERDGDGPGAREEVGLQRADGAATQTSPGVIDPPTMGVPLK